MTKAGLSWKYYSGDRGDDITNYMTILNNNDFSGVDGVPLLFHFYCGICDPLTGYSAIMKNPSEEAKLQSYGSFVRDLTNNNLPAVSFVRPFEALASHPVDSTPDSYEQFLKALITRVQANPALWAKTAIFITTDEGGGYYDSGYIQPVDFFGDGTRVPFIAVSPFAKPGHVDHTYYDHVSMLKFIEKNWGLSKISSRSRDHLPNPKMNDENPYMPENMPAIGDLMNLFTFSKDHDDDRR
jgi:phospholipase C